MGSISDEAVVLGRVDFSETSQVVVFFTREHGKIRAIAKGIKRGTKSRFAVGMDLLDIGHLVVSGRQERRAGLSIVTEWRQSRVLSGLREDLDRLYGALYLAEVTDRLTEDFDPHPRLFDALLSALAQLSGASAEVLSPARGSFAHPRAVVWYQFALLEGIGLLPRFDRCRLCGRAGELTHFSSIEGGVICRHCEPAQVEKRGVSRRVVALCAAGRGDPRLGAPGAEPGLDRSFDATSTDSTTSAPAGRASTSHESWGVLSEAFGLLNYHITHLMGRPPALGEKLSRAAPRPRQE